MSLKPIDHLVYGVKNLNDGIKYFSNILGVTPLFGGRHLKQGTHNAILKIGNLCYLELIAIDPENITVKTPRWMGIDHLTHPKLIRWAIKSSHISTDIRHFPSDRTALNIIQKGERITPNGTLLNWELSLPHHSPLVETIPFLIDWKNSAHPSESLENICELIEITISDPNPEIINEIASKFGLSVLIKKSATPYLNAKIRSPKGIIEI